MASLGSRLWARYWSVAKLSGFGVFVANVLSPLYVPNYKETYEPDLKEGTMAFVAISMFKGVCFGAVWPAVLIKIAYGEVKDVAILFHGVDQWIKSIEKAMSEDRDDV